MFFNGPKCVFQWQRCDVYMKHCFNIHLLKLRKYVWFLLFMADCFAADVIPQQCVVDWTC